MQLGLVIQRALLLGKVMFVPQVISGYRMWTGSTTSDKQASDEWLNQIEYWTSKVSKLAEKQYQNTGELFDAQSFCEEILARNLLSAMYNLLAQNMKAEAKAFYRKHGIPSHATLRTRFKLLKTVIRTYL